MTDRPTSGARDTGRSLERLAARVAGLRAPLDRVSTRMAHVGGWLFMIVSFYISFDVIARKYFGFTTKGADELSSYALALGSTWGLAHVLVQKGHVRIDILWNHFSARVQAYLNVLALALLNLFVGLLAWHAWAMVRESIRLGAEAATPLSTPLMYPQGLWALGLTWFLLIGLLVMLQALLLLAAGQAKRVAGEFGPVALEEELDREMAAVAGVPVDRPGA